jgi:predicted PurR-regulated permease PerM
MKDREDQALPARHQDSSDRKFREYVYRVALAFGVGTVFLLVIGMIWLAGHVVLVVFAGILLAVLLNGASNRMARWLPISRGVALALVILLLVILLGSAGYFLAPRVAVQIDPLIKTLPASLQRLQVYLEQYEWMKEIMESIPPAEEMIANVSGVLKQARFIFSGALGVVANFVIILFVGLYLAAQPQVYITGFLKLVPKKHRPRGREVFKELGITLELWLFGKFLSMIVVGVAAAVGLSLLNVPLAVTLGVIAGLLDFIPYLGPVLAGIPAILMAFSESPTTALYVFMLFVVIQSAESYLVSPLVERKTVSLPPALTISMQVLFAVPFGLMGVALASPMTAALFVLIAMLYVQDVLGDQVETPGDKHDHDD